MESMTEILRAAKQRAQAKNLPYAGELTPAEASRLLELSATARLVDVRSKAELDLVGRIPQAAHIEWSYYPGWIPNPDFITQLKAEVNPDELVMFICRTGGRSHNAATKAVEVGYAEAYNVAQGFEGEADPESRQRGRINGWKAAGLPWIQG